MRESRPVWRAGAAFVGLVALLCSLDDRVPLASGVALAALLPAVLVDLIAGRLPNRLVGSAALLGAVTLTVEFVLSGHRSALSGAAVGALAMSGPLFIAHLVAPAAMGFGDVKAALVAGAALGLVDPILGLAALAIGSAGTAVVGVVTRRRTLVFGPGLICGAVIALVAAVTESGVR
ncbi:prepilin peptidase [Ilumatobacter sp.]|uniref:prepilin peptidase n=1 Tax=Ilumatobacter sp. TaxID=1967498 RepID=UPI003C5A984E